MNTLEAVEIKSPVKRDMRNVLMSIRNAMDKANGVMIGETPEYLKLCPLKHSYAEGCYVRELFMPKDMLFSTRIHKFSHPYFLLKGDVSVLTEEGIKRLKGPMSDITPAGTMRIIYTHEDTIWVTVHVTEEKDPDKFIASFTTDNFDTLDNVITAESNMEIDSLIKQLTGGDNEASIL